jgi:hypothetical protein
MRGGLNNQPDYDNLPERYKSKHLLIVVNADICPTEFVVEQVTLPKVSGVVYGKWDAILNAMDLTTVKAVNAVWHEFDWQTFHRGTQAVSGGWRFFLRASTNTSRIPNNQIRNQTQVYMTVPNAGW